MFALNKIFRYLSISLNCDLYQMNLFILRTNLRARKYFQQVTQNGDKVYMFNNSIVYVNLMLTLSRQIILTLFLKNLDCSPSSDFNFFKKCLFSNKI